MCPHNDESCDHALVLAAVSHRSSSSSRRVSPTAVRCEELDDARSFRMRATRSEVAFYSRVN
jgi:hypothetical protein